MDATDKKRTPRPIQEERIGRLVSRLEQIVNRTSIRTLARNSGVSASTLHNYLGGEGLRTVGNLISIAEAGGESLEWLLGVDQQQPQEPTPQAPIPGQSGDGSLAKTDKELLQRIMLGIEEGLEATGHKVSADKKVELAFALYEIFSKSEAAPDTATILPFLKLA